MIKTEYLDYKLVDINLASEYEPEFIDPLWIASYVHPEKGIMLGCGMKIEEAVAAAQKGIKEQFKGKKVGGLLHRGDQYEFRRNLQSRITNR